jgi:hypothetical protein
MGSRIEACLSSGIVLLITKIITRTSYLSQKPSARLQSHKLEKQSFSLLGFSDSIKQKCCEHELGTLPALARYSV